LLVIAGLVIVYPIVRFLNGDIVLTDLFAFLSPQTFWSRVSIWQDVAAFDWVHLFQGLGAGSLALQDITIDNQFLYAYAELGVLGALVYFALFATLILRLSSGHPFGRTVLVLLCAVFMVGDILNAHALMFVVGLFLGTIRDKEVPVDLRSPATRTRLAKHAASPMYSQG
jgi:hypothetical protein